MTPSYRGAGYIEATAPLVAVAFITLSFRLYTRICISKAPGWEDLVVVIAFINCIGLFAMCTHLAVYNGLGKHYLDLTPAEQQDYSGFLLRFWIAIFFYKTSISASKATLFLQYIRLFTGWTKRVAWVGLCLVTGIFLANTSTNLWFCTPIDKFWNFDKPGHCLPRLPVWFSNAGANIATSTIAILVPLPAIWRLQFPTRTKIALMSLFSVGIVDIVIAVCRLHSLRILSQGTDITYNLRNVSLWSTLECAIAIICASVIVLRPLLSKTWPRWFSTGGVAASSAAAPCSSSSAASDPESAGAAEPVKLSRASRSKSWYDRVGTTLSTIRTSVTVVDFESGDDEFLDESVGSGTRRFVVDGGRVMEKGAVVDHEVCMLD